MRFLKILRTGTFLWWFFIYVGFGTFSIWFPTIYCNITWVDYVIGILSIVMGSTIWDNSKRILELVNGNTHYKNINKEGKIAILALIVPLIITALMPYLINNNYVIISLILVIILYFLSLWLWWHNNDEFTNECLGPDPKK